MEELVTLDQLKAHLKLSGTAEDDDIQMKLEIAQELVITYLKNRRTGGAEWAAEVDAWTDETAPAAVKGAIQRMFGNLYLDRGDLPPQDQPKTKPGELPENVTSLLYPWRDPSIA